MGKLYSEKGEGLRCVDGTLLARRSWRQELETGILWYWSGEHIWLSQVSLELEVGEKSGKPAGIDQVLTALGRLLQGFWLGSLDLLLQRLWFGFLSDLLQGMWVGVLITYGLILVHLHNQSIKAKMSLSNYISFNRLSPPGPYFTDEERKAQGM